MSKISLIITRGGQYKTPSAKNVITTLTTIDNASNIYPLLIDRAQTYGFSLNTLRPGKVQRMIRKFTDLFRSNDYLAKRLSATNMLNDFEKTLIESAKLHQKNLTRKRYPWEI